MKKILFFLAMFAFPAALPAQHGNGGFGGTTASGTGLNSGNRASGIDTKDALRDFHEIIAVQATRLQKAAYGEMIKTAEGAAAELKGFSDEIGQEQEKTGKAKNAAEIARHDKALQDAIEASRTLNKKFLESFSETQKMGLKEISRHLSKADLELGQSAKSLDAELQANAAPPQMAGPSQGLERALAAFQKAQLELGDEMSIDVASLEVGGNATTFNLPEAKQEVNVGSQQIRVTTSGVVSKAASGVGDNRFSVELTEDLSDLQLSIADLLRSRIDKSERCGERIAVAMAALTPQDRSSQIVMQLRYERWMCNTVFGRETENEMTAGTATIETKLMPSVSDDGTLRLTAIMGRVDAPGSLGDSLRTGPVGESLRERSAEALLSVIRQGGDFKAALPVSARTFATLSRAQFVGTGSGKLMLALDGEMRVPNENLAAVTDELKARAAEAAASSVARPELMVR